MEMSGKNYKIKFSLAALITSVFILFFMSGAVASDNVEDIKIISANYLDEDRNFLLDVFGLVELLDGVWSGLIEVGEYVRVVFEKNLTSKNDITIFAQSIGEASVEVYEKDGSELLMTFDDIGEPKLHKLYLDDLVGEQDTFDLKILGAAVSFDWITDPWANETFGNCKNINITSSAALDDFPALINVTYDSDMQTDYSDLRFYSAGCGDDGSLLAHEFDNYTATRALTWVRTNLSVGVNTISVYYKNDTAVSSGENAAGVWDDNYVMVQHMSEVDENDSTSFGHNGTWTGNSLSASGQIGNAADFDGTGDISVTNTATFDNLDALTVELWINADNAANVAISRFGINNGLGLYSDGNWYMGDGSWTLIAHQRQTDSAWHYFTLVKGAGNSVMESFRNANSVAVSSSFTADYSLPINSVLEIGADNRDGDDITALIDEVRISSAARSDDWINMTYEIVVNQDSLVTFGDEEINNVAPVVVLNAPLNDSNISVDYALLNATVTDADGDNMTVWFYGDGVIINTTLDVVNGSTVTYNWTSLGEGLHNWSVIAGDGTLNTSSSTFYFTVDTVLPTIVLNAPVDTFNSSSSSVNFNWTAVDNLDTSISCDLTIDGVVNASGIESLNNTATNYSVSGFADGAHTWNVSCTDNSANVNTSETRSFTVDTVLPLIEFVSPTTAAGSYIRDYISANVTVSDDNLDTTVIYLYNSTSLVNSSVGTFVNFTGLSSGIYYLNASANDTSGNLNSTETLTITLIGVSINVIDFYGLNSTLGRVDNFNTSTLQTIEYMELNFSIDAAANIDSWYLNFTANGTSGCSTGNKQDSICYSYGDSVNKWIQFINGSETATYDDMGPSQGDAIDLVETGSGSDINLSFRIDEHYNPNIFKWYGAMYNFSDVKWQDGVDQRINGNNEIKVEFNNSIVPVNADQYRLDFRVDVTGNPTNHLEVYFCNSSYVSGDVHSTSGCVFIAQKLPAELQDDGMKFRTIFTSPTINALGDAKWIVLHTDETNVSNYYSLKTYGATTPSYTTHWEYSNDSGATWINSEDGYETELNINWFYNNGATATAFVYSLWANTTTGEEQFLEGNITWAIDATNNYPPVPYITSPTANSVFNLPHNITFTVVEPNLDSLNLSLYLYQGGSLNDTIVTGLDENATNYSWSGSLVSGNYSLVLEACENATSDLFCANYTRSIVIDNTFPLIEFVAPTTASGNFSQDYIVANVSVVEDNLDTIVVYLYNSTGLVNSSVGALVNFTSLNDGTYLLNATVNDTSGNSNSSATRTIVLDTSAPEVYIIHPLPDGHTHDEHDAVAITLNVSTPYDIDSIYANINAPNGTNYTLTNFSIGLRSDNFDTDTLGTNWVRSNYIDDASSQVCTTDIDGTVPGKMFLGISGVGSTAQTFCDMNSLKALDGDFDVNMTFNVTLFEPDSRFGFRSNNAPSTFAMGARVFMVFRNIAGAFEYNFGYNYGNGTSTTAQQVSVNDTFGKFRIKRFNTSTSVPVFNLYYWNNSGDEWINILGNISLPTSHRTQFIEIKAMSVLSDFGNINMTVENFSVSSVNNYTFALFNQTEETGIYNVSVFVNDSFGKLNDSETTFFNITEVNDAPSRPVIAEPDAGDVVSGTFSIMWNLISDEEGDSFRFNITLLNSDGSDNSTIVSDYGDNATNSYAWDTTTVLDGLYSIRINVYENETVEGNHHSDTLNGNFTVHNTPPFIELISPLNGSTITSSLTVGFEYNVTDDLNVDNCSLIVDESLSSTDTSITKNITQSISSTLTNGNYNWSVNCTDAVGNENFSVTRDFTLNVAAAVTPSSGGSSGGSSIQCFADSGCDAEQYCLSGRCLDYECNVDSECSGTETCWLHRCVILFDMKIEEVQSPIIPGESFTFTYFLKGVAEIHGDVTVRFWLEKDGEIVTQGFDTIYMGDFEEKTETTELFLPSTIKPGTYNFYSEVNYGSYHAQALRVIEVEGSSAVSSSRDITGRTIADTGEVIRENAYFLLVVLGILVLLGIIYWERREIGRALVPEGRWINRHKVSIGAFLFFIVSVGILFYSDKAELIKLSPFNISFVKFLYVAGLVAVVGVVLARVRIRNALGHFSRFVKSLLVKKREVLKIEKVKVKREKKIPKIALVKPVVKPIKLPKKVEKKVKKIVKIKLPKRIEKKIIREKRKAKQKSLLERTHPNLFLELKKPKVKLSPTSIKSVKKSSGKDRELERARSARDRISDIGKNRVAKKSHPNIKKELRSIKSGKGESFKKKKLSSEDKALLERPHDVDKIKSRKSNSK